MVRDYKKRGDIGEFSSSFYFLREHTLRNQFYSCLHNFLNLEKRKYFILEEDYKLRAAMYDVEPRAPR